LLGGVVAYAPIPTSSFESIVIAVASAADVIPATPTPVKAAPDMAGNAPVSLVASIVVEVNAPARADTCFLYSVGLELYIFRRTISV
jgi:hypothetical protein